MAEFMKLMRSRNLGYDSVGVGQEDDKEASKKAHASAAGGNSVLVTAGVIIGDTLGAGLLTMSSAVAVFGWLLGSVLVLGMLALNVHVCMLLWRLRMEFPQAHTLGELAEATFGRAAGWQRSLVRKLVDQVQAVFIFFLLAADCTSFGKGLGLLFYDVHLCLPTWVLVGAAALLPIHARTRSLGGNKVLIFVNCMAVLCCVGLCMNHFAAVKSRPMDSEFMAITPLSVMGVLNGLNIMTFNFTIQFMVVEVVAEMESPKKFPVAMWGYAYPFLAALFLVCGTGGYFFLGDHSHGLLISHLPFGLPLRFAAACLVFFVLVAYLLKSVVLCKAIHSFFDPAHADSGSARSEAGYTVIIALMLGAAFLTSQLVPFFTPLVDLIGATLAPLCCIALPILLHTQFHRTFRRGDGLLGAAGTAEWSLIALEVALCVLLMTVGTYDSMLTILAGWKEFGSPFSCHCEHLWNTCGCSHANPGMQEACPILPAERFEPTGALAFGAGSSEAPGLSYLRQGMWWY